jgi:archaellum component FlaG (FlaF/FlaG flagellin family)
MMRADDPPETPNPLIAAVLTAAAVAATTTAVTKLVEYVHDRLTKKADK